MVDSDEQMIEQSRTLTDYDEFVYTDFEFQSLVDLCKEELRDHWDEPGFDWYGSDTLTEDRALFWFLCIAARIRAGEYSAMDISVADIQLQSADGDFFIAKFNEKMDGVAGGPSAASANIERSVERDYSFE